MQIELEPRTAIHPFGRQIEFHPDSHLYLLDDEPLISVTTLIHRWFPSFDAEAVAKRKAEREGRDYLALLAEWERQRNEAAEFGSKAHAMAERILLTGDESSADALANTPREQAYLPAIKEAIRRILKGYEVIGIEKIVFSPERRVAGTIDLLLRHRETGEYVVADWKTNREIKYKPFAQEMGLGPCAHIAHCNFNHYSLQTSAYSSLLEGEGYLAPEASVRGVLLHLREKAGGRVECEYLKTRDFRREVGDILRMENAR